MFSAAGIFIINSSIFTYSSAGHNPLVIYKKENDTIELYGTKGVAIGFIENYSYKESSFELKNGDIVEVADALGDMMYILCGTIIEHGMQHIIEEVFDEIHRSNLSKLDENGNPIYREDGKVIKGPNYFPPDIKKIIKKYL